MFLIERSDADRLFRIMRRLYTENRLSGDGMRDMAQGIESVLRHAMSEKTGSAYLRDDPGHHELQIHSLHDARATCTCGRWSLLRTGAMTRDEIEAEYARHHALGGFADGLDATG
jgi:hypothetical protein